MDYLKVLKWISPFLRFTYYVDEPGTGGDGKKEGTVSKEEYDQLIESKEKLEKELDDTRTEVYTEEYLDFLDHKDKSKSTPVTPPVKSTPESDDKFEKMSKKELFELAVQTAKESLNGTLENAKSELQKREDDKSKQAVAVFARTHDDYEKYRPTMYGLSLRQDCKDLTLGELYEKAKEHIRSLNDGPTKEELEKLKKLGGMHPGGGSDTYEKVNEKVSISKAANDAAIEVAEKLGPIPSA